MARPPGGQLRGALREAADDAEAVDRPLVLDAARRRLYLARYWYFQQRLARLLVQRIAAPPLPLDEDRLAGLIARLFPKREQAGDRDQCLAVANAVDQRLSIITGGPGTGKTTTVAKLLALRLMLTAADDGRPAGLKVLLMAPTGKAAQRLNESLGRATRSLPVDDAVRTALEEVRAGTMHRLLGWTPLPPERGGPFLHTAEFPLEADVVLIDEASMVDLGLMWRLFDAVRPEAQVVLIGDRDQLASVEAGGVLSDLCGGVAAAGAEQLSAERRACVAARTGLPLPAGLVAARGVLDDHVVPLRYSHRFDPASGLGRLAAAIRAGDAEAAIGALRAADAREIQWLQPTAPGDALAAAVQCAAAYYADYLQLLAADPTGSAGLLAALNRFRVLCADREGRWGEVTLNRLIAERLDDEGRIRLRSGWYLGRPVMVTRNDYRQQLFNGDVGVVVQDDGRAGWAILFDEPSAPGSVRRVPAALVPDAKTCFAMTIHKSQGSEFHRVLVVLPERHTPLLSRELLYTAVTRVSDAVDAASGQRRPGTLHLLATEAVLRETVECRMRRSSGLRDAIEAEE